MFLMYLDYLFILNKTYFEKKKRIMVAQDMAASCGHILGHHEPIPTKYGVRRFFIMLYRNMKKKIMKMLKKYF